MAQNHQTELEVAADNENYEKGPNMFKTSGYENIFGPKKRLNVSLSEIEELQIGITENCKTLNDSMNDNHVNEVIGTATKKVPSVVKIFGTSTEGVSYGCLSNSNYEFLNIEYLNSPLCSF